MSKQQATKLPVTSTMLLYIDGVDRALYDWPFLQDNLLFST